MDYGVGDLGGRMCRSDCEVWTAAIFPVGPCFDRRKQKGDTTYRSDFDGNSRKGQIGMSPYYARHWRGSAVDILGSRELAVRKGFYSDRYGVQSGNQIKIPLLNNRL